MEALTHPIVASTPVGVGRHRAQSSVRAFVVSSQKRFTKSSDSRQINPSAGTPRDDDACDGRARRRRRRARRRRCGPSPGTVAFATSVRICNDILLRILNMSAVSNRLFDTLMRVLYTTTPKSFWVLYPPNQSSDARARRTPRGTDFANRKPRLSYRARRGLDTSGVDTRDADSTIVFGHCDTVEGAFPFAVDVEFHLVERRKR